MRSRGLVQKPFYALPKKYALGGPAGALSTRKSAFFVEKRRMAVTIDLKNRPPKDPWGRFES